MWRRISHRVLGCLSTEARRSWRILGRQHTGNESPTSYDELYPSSSNTHAMVETLAKLAGAGPVLELGIGTGRVALPLASNGLTVHGIDASEAMIKRLQAKPGGASISVTIGDFANVDVAGRYSLIYVVFKTFLRSPHRTNKYAALPTAPAPRCGGHVLDRGFLS
jgi:SAM-dependent methyltransferase